MKKSSNSIKSKANPAHVGPLTNIEAVKIALVYQDACKGKSVRDSCRENGIEYERAQYLVKNNPRARLIRSRSLDKSVKAPKTHAHTRKRFVRNIHAMDVNRKLDEWLKGRGLL